MTDALPLLELGVILLSAAVLGTISRRLGLPAVFGYLLVGLAVGPFTPGYVADRNQVQLLADVGVILLLFEVGIELDLRTLRREPRGIIAAAALQVGLGTAAGMLLLGALGVEPLGASVLAFAASLSSSVVVINITRSRRRTTSPATERALVVWAVLQDVFSLLGAAVLSVVLFPGSAGSAVAIAKLVAFVLFAGAVHIAVVPRLLRTVRGESDTFLISSVAVALTTAAVGSLAFGVPIALAAFVAGLALSTRPEAKEARREVLPFRDVFAVMFFVGVGTLVDPAALPANAQWLAAALGLVVLKVALGSGLVRLFRVPARALQLGVGLGQLGEVSFVVLGLGVAAGVVSGGQFAAFLAAAVLTIALSAVGVRMFPPRHGTKAAGAD